MSFEQFNFKPLLNKAIKEAGFKEPSPVQEAAIPVVLEGNDVIAQAHTGTGKTAAFALPMLQQCKVDGEVEGLVIVPTRELAMQVSDEIFKFGKFLGVKTATVYGGSSYSRQLHHIDNATVVIATPGRLIDLLKSGKITLNPSFVVLDEADEMMDMGFLDDIKEIFTYIPQDRQTMMFSATMPEAIKALAKKTLKDPKIVSITKNSITNENIAQQYYVVDEYERDQALVRLLDYMEPTKSIVFCRMKKEVDRLGEFLNSQGFLAKGLHGDMDQRQREAVIKSFKSNGLDILIATDVAARGLDVNDVSHVFNYHLPFDSESYVHRIGRTGRGGKTGLAVSIVTPAEFKSLSAIQKATGKKLHNDAIPAIEAVQSKKLGSFIKKVKDQKITNSLEEVVYSLRNELDDDELIIKLVSMLYNQIKIKGNNKIGKSKKETDKLLDIFEQEKYRSKNNRNRNRSQRNRGRGFNRNRSRNSQ